MRSFYLYIFALMGILLGLSGVVLYVGMTLSEIDLPLIPRENSLIPWIPSVEPSKPSGKARLEVLKEGKFIEYDFYLPSEKKYPYAGYNFDFVDPRNNSKLVDLRGFDSISFDVSCSPRNILLLVLFTYDDEATDLSDHSTFRVNWHFFTCDDNPSEKVAKLRDFETPDWWLQNFGLELVDRAYNLEKVIGLAVINSLQSPRDTPSSASLSSLSLSRTDSRYIILASTIVAAMWIFFIYWALHQYINKLVEAAKERMKEDLPLVAYQKLSLDFQKDQMTSDLLLYLAAEYSNPDLSVELVTSKFGINRNKVGEILRDELGYTFSAYVNRLRLTEAARLLCLPQTEAVKQVSFRVGFNNATYFSKLFKQTYGCSPKRFKESQDITGKDVKE